VPAARFENVRAEAIVWQPPDTLVVFEQLDIVEMALNSSMYVLLSVRLVEPVLVRLTVTMTGEPIPTSRDETVNLYHTSLRPEPQLPVVLCAVEPDNVPAMGTHVLPKGIFTAPLQVLLEGWAYNKPEKTVSNKLNSSGLFIDGGFGLQNMNQPIPV
jgi:hypothetical protein